MKFEHFALNVADVHAHAQWYVAHLGLAVAARVDIPPPTKYFLADSTGRIIVELYTNTTAAIPDYRNQHPLVLHVALVSANAAADRARLEKAGATFFAEDKLADGSHLVMLRDPWGVPLQICQRAKPFPMP